MGKIISILKIFAYALLYYLFTSFLSYTIEYLIKCYNKSYIYIASPIIYSFVLILLVLILKIRYINKFSISKSNLFISIISAMLIWGINYMLLPRDSSMEKYFNTIAIISYCTTYIILAPLVFQLFFNKFLLNILIHNNINVFVAIVLIGFLSVFVNGYPLNGYWISLLTTNFIFCAISSLIYIKSGNLIYSILYNSIFNICAISVKYLIN
jgi:hypothetical protein